MQKPFQKKNNILNLIRSFFIMIKAHRGQRDKSGRSYIFHPLTVASKVKGFRAKSVALLHDVIEDNDKYSLDKFSFLDDEQLEAIELLTHKQEDPYFVYIRKIKDNEIAKEVKLKDLEHNSDLNRLKTIEEKDIERLEKYKAAKQILLS